MAFQLLHNYMGSIRIMKTDRIVELATEKSRKRHREVINTINKMIKRGDKVSFYSVVKETGASKSYLYTNVELRSLIELARNQAVKPRSVKGNKVIIEAQQRKIEELTARIKELEDNYGEGLMSKYEKVLQENKRLKLQLKNSTYSY